MKNYLILAALITGVSVLSLSIAAVDTEQSSPPKALLSLSSGYASDGSVACFEARSIQFALEQTGQGWKGWLTLDPNFLNFSEFGRLTGSTLLAGEKIAVTLRLAGEDKRSGRRCYEVTQDRFDAPMCLVFPKHANGIYRLIIGGEGAATRSVVFLEAVDREPLFVGSTPAHSATP